MRKISVRPLIAAFVLLITITMIMIVSTASAFAASDYTTKSFNVNAEASKSHVISITEKITVDFSSGHHGITRYIPVESKYYKIKNVKTPGFDNNIEYDSNNKSSYEMIRIGNADEYLTGVHTFTLSYDMVCYRDDSTSMDYLSLDMLPSGWDTAIGAARLTLTMPEKMDWSKAKFYAGSYGTKGSLSPYFTKSINGNKLTIIGKNIPEEYGVTVNSDLKEGY